MECMQDVGLDVTDQGYYHVTTENALKIIQHSLAIVHCLHLMVDIVTKVRSNAPI